ncbi:MAG: hypothetical protein QG672_2765 [Pseudomonadota bacterium]|nr:hypothetical protein [Pseudomonadota bacterium]
MKHRKLLWVGLLSAAAMLGGCASGHYYHDEPVVRVAPPPPYVEYVGHPPVAGHIWITGYWNWGGTRHVWVPGRWEAPRPGYTWVPHRWERSGDHWRQHGGQWERHGATAHQSHNPPPQVRHEAPRVVPIERRPEHRTEPQRHEQRFEQRTESRQMRDARPAPERHFQASVPRDIGRPPQPGPELRPDLRPEPRPIQRVEQAHPVERRDENRGPGEVREHRENRPTPERSSAVQTDQRGDHRAQRSENERPDRKRERGPESNPRDERR